MAIVVKDRVKVSTTTTGTGTITLGSADPGFQTFSVVGDGNQTYYAITSGNNFEVGIGTYTHSGTTLSRDTVLESSNSGAKITLAGTSTVFTTYPAEKSSFRNVGIARDYTASGSITAGKPLILNADNTVTQVGTTTVASGLGTLSTNTVSNAEEGQVAMGATNQFVNLYRVANTTNMYLTPNTISSTDLKTITRGTTANFDAGKERNAGIIYEPNQDKYVVIALNSSDYLTATTVTFSGTGSSATLTLGTQTVIDSNVWSGGGFTNANITYDTTAQKIVVSGTKSGANNGICIVINLDGTTFTQGSRTTIPLSSTSLYASDGGILCSYSSTANKVVFLHCENSQSDSTAINYTNVGTVSGTSISFGSAQAVGNPVDTGYSNMCLDTTLSVDNNGVIVITYLSQSYALYSQSATLSGTTLTWGNTSQISNITVLNGAFGECGSVKIASGKTIIVRATKSDSPSNANKGIFCVITVSGTSVTNGSVQEFSSSATRYPNVSSNYSKTQALINFGSGSENNIIFQESAQTGESNLTNDNYFGIASSSASDTAAVGVNRPGSINIDQTGLTAGKDYYAKDDGTIIERTTTSTTTNTFATATIESLTTVNPSANQKIDIIYDTHNDKVWAYSKDSDNSNYPTVVVGDISSGTSITWGTPVTVTSNSYAPTGIQSQRNLASDGAGNILVAYRDTSNDYARVKVGNYSGTNSATFGNELQPDNISALQTIDIGYCSSANLWYMFHGNSTSTKWVLMKQNSGNKNFDSSDVGTLHTGNATGINNVYTTNNKIIVGLDATGNGKFYVCNTSADGSTNTGYTLNIGTVQNITITNNSSADGRLKIITDTTNNNYILIDSTGSTGMNCSVITESSGSLTQSTPQGVASSSGTMAGNTAFYNPSDQKFYGAYQVHTSPYACKNYLLTVSGTTFTFVDGVDMPNADDRGLWTQGIYIADITKGVFVGQTNNGYDLLTAIMNINSTTSTTINASQFVGTARSGTDLELAEPPTELVGIANGSITKGNAVVVRSDGDFETIKLVTSTPVTNTGTASQGSLGNIDPYTQDMFCMAVASDGVTYCFTYQNSTNNYQACKIGTRSGETITWGSEITLSTDTSSDSHFCSYDANANVFITSYATGNTIKSTAVSFSGNAGTKGTEVTMMDLGSSSGSPQYHYQHWYDSTNKVTVCWANGGVSGNDTNRSSAVTLNLSGTTINLGTLYENSSAGGDFQKGCDITGGKHVCYWKNSSGYASVMTMTVASDYSITWGTPLVINSSNAGFCNPIYNPNYENKVILAGKIKTSNNYFSYAGLTISGTSITASNFSDGNINNASSYVESGGNVGVYSNYSGNYCFVYQTYSPYYSTYRFATTTDGLSLTVAAAVTTSGHGNNQFYAGAVASDVDAVVVENHRDGANTQMVYYCFNPTFSFTTTSQATNLTTNNFLGFAQQTVANREDVKVAIIGQTDNNQSSLSTATQYYLNNTTGALQSTADNISVVGGTALSSTKILIKS